MPTTKTYAQWMAEVNAAIEKKYGLSSDDLPDCTYRDWYEEGATAKQAAGRAIRLARDEGDF